MRALTIFFAVLLYTQTVFAQSIMSEPETVLVPSNQDFRGDEHFQIGSKNLPLKIYFFSREFRANLIPKTERASPSVGLKVRTLWYHKTADQRIIAALGEDAEITLSQFYHILALQGIGQKGPLRTNGLANMAFIRDGQNTLWAVTAVWSSVQKAWFIIANLPNRVDDEYRWLIVERVISR